MLEGQYIPDAKKDTCCQQEHALHALGSDTDHTEAPITSHI
jgi:hypothetical protein